MDTNPQRWILHLDMDAFYASVEQLDTPEYRGKPLVIGGAERGVVSTASYEARAFGIRSAMPMFQARKLCPQAIFIRGRMGRYQEKSREVMAILERFSPCVEKASIDEAFLDLTGLERIFGGIRELGETIQKSILEETGLSCSIGIAPVKFLAKIASDLKKPAGLAILQPEDIADFLRSLPVGKIPGVGKQTLGTLEELGVRTASDVARYPAEFWHKRMGKAGEILYDRARGIDPRAVEPYSDPKSESAENTFAQDTRDMETLSVWLLRQSERVGASLRAQNRKGRTITLKLKYGDFTQKTRSRTIKRPTNSTRVIYEAAMELLAGQPPERPLRLIGVGVSNFGEVERQFSLVPEADEQAQKREDALDAALDALRGRFGRDAVLRGKLFKNDSRG